MTTMIKSSFNGNIAEHRVTVAPNQHILNTRGAGWTTAIALATLSAAIANPGEPVSIQDHYLGDTKQIDEQATRRANTELLYVIGSMIKQLELEGIVVDRRRLTVTTARRGVMETAQVFIERTGGVRRV